MGALEYEPADEIPAFCLEKINLDSLSGEIKKIFNSDEYIFDELRLLNGSSGGARPKIIANISSGAGSSPFFILDKCAIL